MIPSVIYRPRARLDLLDQFEYFDEQASLKLAERYLAAVRKTCLQLARHPLSGKPCGSRIERLRSLRRFPVTGFDHYFIFYAPQTGGIDVIRVLHCAQDLDRLFAEDENTGSSEQ